jgi:hypothetical protein
MGTAWGQAARSRPVPPHPARQEKPVFPWENQVWRDRAGWAGMTMRGLENHCGGNVTVGSNPTPSADVGTGPGLRLYSVFIVQSSSSAARCGATT